MLERRKLQAGLFTSRRWSAMLDLLASMFLDVYMDRQPCPAKTELEDQLVSKNQKDNGIKVEYMRDANILDK